MELSIGVGIPAYRNPSSLRKCLTSIYRELGSSFTPVLVVDDSGDGQVAAALASEFPLVEWKVHEQNEGFGIAANAAVMESKGEIVILLNDDAELSCDPRAALLSAFADERLFGVTFRSTHADGSLREGAKRVVWRTGIPRVLHNPEDQLPAVHGVQPTDYIVGGHGAFRKKYFAELGGMDDFFAPFYWEDVDLTFRARSRGWRAIHLHSCTVVHDGVSAIRTNYERERIKEITWRNRLRFAKRHGSRVQRILLRVSRLWLLAHAVARGDRSLRAAIRNAE